VELYAHNRQACELAVELLDRTGKAAVIHRTGTGKSFVGFQLCLDHPDQKICWLSPSEYIYKTQIENLSLLNNGHVPSNIVFITYAKLMLLSLDEKT